MSPLALLLLASVQPTEVPVPAPEPVAPAATPAPRPAKPAAPTPWRLNPPERWYALRAGAELGFVGVLMHKIQFGQAGTRFDFREEGGQSTLFPFVRFTGEWEVKKRHSFVFLIQPLKLRSTATAVRDVRVDDVVFAAGTPMRLSYDFGFYRFSYLFDFFKDPEQELAIGLSLQLRNAAIDFASSDGAQQVSNRNLGVVPILKLRGRYTWKRHGVWLGGEIDGFYASGRIVTGSRNDFVGAIVDASTRVGFWIPRAGDAFVNVRYVGGGARGTEEDDQRPGDDGFTDNWLHTMALSVGVYIR